MKNNKTISVCMGSSCFTRGNNKVIEVIKKYISDTEVNLSLKGNLCNEYCPKGPVIKIDDKVFYEVSPENVLDIIKGEINH